MHMASLCASLYTGRLCVPVHVWRPLCTWAGVCASLVYPCARLCYLCYVSVAVPVASFLVHMGAHHFLSRQALMHRVEGTVTDMLPIIGRFTEKIDHWPFEERHDSEEQHDSDDERHDSDERHGGRSTQRREGSHWLARAGVELWR